MEGGYQLGILARIDESINQFVWGKIRYLQGRPDRPKSKPNHSDRINTEIESAIQNLKNGSCDDALSQVDSLLLRNPNTPSVLFLKALIVWEGFGDSNTANSELNEVINLLPGKNGELYHMASDLLAKIALETTSNVLANKESSQVQKAETV
jgi:hypothetical protein